MQIIGYKGIQQRLTSHSISSDNLKTAVIGSEWLAQISKLFWTEDSKHTEIIFSPTRFIEALLYQHKETDEERHACW